MENLELLMFGPWLLALGLGLFTPFAVISFVRRRTKSWWRVAGACVFVSPVAAFLIGGTICVLPRIVWGEGNRDIGYWFFIGGDTGAFAAGFALFWLLIYTAVYFVGRSDNHRENLPVSPFFPPVTTQPPGERESQCNP
jgi:hypothetical protein